jgi:predicted amidophosphoribosyltransferase
MENEIAINGWCRYSTSHTKTKVIVKIFKQLFQQLRRFLGNMNKCLECGAELKEQDKFCSQCGLKVPVSSEKGGVSESGASQATINHQEREYSEELSRSVAQSKTNSDFEQSGENLRAQQQESDRSYNHVAKIDEGILLSEVLSNQKPFYEFIFNLTARVETIATNIERLQLELEKLALQQKQNTTTLQTEILEIKGEFQEELQKQLQQERQERSEQRRELQILINSIKKLFSSFAEAGKFFEEEQASTESRRSFSSSSTEVEKMHKKEQPSTRSTNWEENMQVIDPETQNDYAKASIESKYTVLAYQEEELLKDYKDNSNLLLEKATVVAEAKKSIEGNRLGAGQTILEENRRGKYWVIKQGGLEYLVPSKKIKINEFNHETVERLFECRGFQKEKSNDVFELLKPTKVHYLKTENQWHVTEKGILEFH